MKRLFFLIFIVLSSNLFAADDILHFSSQSDLNRYYNLTQQIRCVVCQGQNIADSNAPLANDLRNKVSQMVIAKKSDADIKEYLVQRYGEYILYQPRLNKLTFVLWAFPFFGVLLILGVAINKGLRSRQSQVNRLI